MTNLYGSVIFLIFCCILVSILLCISLSTIIVLRNIINLSLYGLLSSGCGGLFALLSFHLHGNNEVQHQHRWLHKLHVPCLLFFLNALANFVDFSLALVENREL